MYKSPLLDDIRQKIDALDNQIHDCLMQRADLVMHISAEKKKNNIQIVQPAREARMMRRLLGRHKAPLPEETIVRIWRELVGSISLLQTGLSVAVYVDTENSDASNHYWDMARDYFGTVLPMKREASIKEMLQAVDEDKINFAVLPYPKLEEENPWWPFLKNFPALKVIQRLPYGQKENFTFENYPALVVAKAGFDTSDEDHTLLLIESGDDKAEEISRARIVESIKKIGLTPLFCARYKDIFCVEVNEYCTEEEERLKTLVKYINSEQVKVQILGGFPTPLTYKKFESVKDDSEAE